ncbi:MAG: hypothetical protein KDK33_20605 [Leptospiraceae bacterium]|nr:hypothetical protein [Leptospiraceae bacterium]
MKSNESDTTKDMAGSEKANKDHGIDWTMPAISRGMMGSLDRFIGPGANASEIVIQFLPAVLAALIAPYYLRISGGAPIWNYFIAAILALDIVGGVLTNATSPAKRWYHRPGQSALQHFMFSGSHVFHLLAVGFFFADRPLFWTGINVSFLLIAVSVVLISPLYLKRPVAMLLYAIGLLLAIYVTPGPQGLEWFLPLFFLKLLVSHLIPEAPFVARKSSEIS